MHEEMRRGLGLCREAARRNRAGSLSVPEIKLGRWKRLHNLVFMCCGLILIFFAIVTVVSNSYEPSIAAAGAGQPSSRWYASDLTFTGEEQLSVSQIRRILAGGLTSTTLQLQEDVVEEQRRETKFTHGRTEKQPEVIEDEPSLPDYSNPLDMVPGIKIFVYDLPSEYNSDWLNDSRCSSHLFAAEVALHQILLKSPVRTMDPDAADFFFVPVYVSCDFSTKNGFPSLANATTMIRAAVDLISQQMIYWNRKGGSDHVFVATHDYGACFEAMESLATAAGVPEFLQKSIILQTFGQNGGYHPCQLEESIVIPPYVSLQSMQEYWAPVENQERGIWAHFRGKLELHPKNVSGQFYSKGIRTRLWHRFKKNGRFFVKRKRLEGYQSELLHSKFCLAPLGWAPWSPRIVESVVYGCVPVIIADNISLPFSHIIDWPSISLTVREKDVENLDQILRHVVATNLTAIQKNLWKAENRRALIYSSSLLPGDASWHIFNLLAKKKRFREAHDTLEPHEHAMGGVQESQSRAESYQSYQFSSV